MTEFANIELPLIVSSTTNPRKHFNQAKLTELADSIKASGVHQPVLVRPLPGSRVADTPRGVQYELVCGERRYRASVDAGVSTIPAMVRALTNEQVLEIQIVENLQRDDLTELEEAEGYEALMQHANINADQVGIKIGKSRSYVYGHLKLLDLSIDCKQAMREGKIDASRALLIARIPDSKLQAKALTAATAPDYRGDVSSVRAFQAWLQSNVMLRLDEAPFVITDKRLVASAGSCKDCPKRTGANPDLFMDVSSSDMCTDPVCFHNKEDAHRAALIARATKKGQTFIEGKEAKELIPHQYSNHIDGYYPLGQVRNDVVADHKGKTLRELLGSDAPGAVLIENPYTKQLIEAVPENEAEAVLLAKGLINTEVAGQMQRGKKADLGKSLEKLEQVVKTKTAKAVRRQVFDATVQAVLASSADMAQTLLCSSHFLRAYLLTQMDESMHNEDMAQALGYTFAEGEDETDALTQHIKACSAADLQRAAVIVMAETDRSFYYSDTTPLLLDTLVDLLDVPAKAITKAATKEVLAEHAEERAALQAQIDAQKQSAPKVPATPPEQTSTGKVKAPAAKRKISAAEATASIAAAMQEASDQAQDVAVEVEDEEKYTTAVNIVVVQQRASISLIQRMLGIGYNAAARLIERMEAEGIVSAVQSDGSRKVLRQDSSSRTVLSGRVTVLAGKYKGKQGTITQDQGDDCYRVKIDRVSVATSFTSDQIEMVQEVAA
jgi:ParB/RepB/Spo0J family partition protein